MNFLPESFTKLAQALSRLPGIGPKSAQRLAFHLLKSPEGVVSELAEAVANVKQGALTCGVCFSLGQESPCRLCEDPTRDRTTLCVVESTQDLIAIEKTGEYKGLYHVLGGRLSPLDGIGPEELSIGELMARLTEEGDGVDGRPKIRELILALNPDLEGDTTALYLQKKLAGGVLMSRLARGIPTGGHVEYTDDATLIRALQGRQSLG